MLEKESSSISFKNVLIGLLFKERDFPGPFSGKGVKRTGGFPGRRKIEEKVCKDVWVPIRYHVDQLEAMEEERIEKLCTKVFDEEWDPESLEEFTQEEISQNLIAGRIPMGMDFNSFVDFIEAIEVIPSEDF